MHEHVTQVIRDAGLGADFSRIPPAVLEAAAARGRAVHRAVELIEFGEVDETTIPERLRPYVDAYRQWRSDVQFRAIAVEHKLTHPVHSYCGRLDSVGWLNASRGLIDTKTSVAIDAGPLVLQLAAYWMAWNETYPLEPLQFAGCLQLTKRGQYRWRRHDLARAQRVFLAALHLVRGQADESELAELAAWRRDYTTTGVTL